MEKEHPLIIGCDRGLCKNAVGRQDRQLNTYDWLADVPGNIDTTDLVEVQFKHTRKGYYHNVNNLDLKKGDIVAVEANPGHDIGVVTLTGRLVPLQIKKANLKSPDEAFARAFSATQPNVVILNTARSPQLNSTLARLNTLTAANPQVKIALYGYTEWLMYTKVYNQYFHKYETYIPTYFYYNAENAKTQQLERNYKQWFKGDMMSSLPRFAITGYDQANFFLRGLHRYGKDFKGTKDQNTYVHLQTPLNFKSAAASGGMQNEAFMLVHYMNNGNIESINY